MTILQAVVMGLVQGLAEFLPISSSGHLMLARTLMGISEAEMETGAFMMLEVLLHGGTLLALLAVFWKDWLDMLCHPIRNKTLLLLIIATLPTVVATLLLKDVLDTLFTGWFLGISFLITAVLLLAAESLSRRAQDRKRTEEPTVKHALWMGIMQAVAILPGVSRSGATLTGGLCTGLSRKSAARFAFMMSAPAVLGSFVWNAKEMLETGSMGQIELVPTLIAVVVAAVSGFLAVKYMLNLVRKSTLYGFALYVAVIGLIVLVLQLAGSSLVPAFVLPGT